jgi:putative addiction module component (TIGR02574 family)
MSSQATQVLQDAMKLPEADRADVAACLFASLEREPNHILDPGWETEIERRLKEIDSGRAIMLSWDEARARMFGNA